MRWVILEVMILISPIFFPSRHGISRTDFNLLSDPELSFMEISSKLNSNPGAAEINRSTPLDDDKIPSPSGSIKTEPSLLVESFSSKSDELGNNGQGGEIAEQLSQPHNGGDKMSELAAPVLSSLPVNQSSVTATPRDTSLTSTLASSSPSRSSSFASQDQIVREDCKPEDMDDSSVPPHLNTGVCQDEDSQLSYNQENQSSESSLFSVRWPKVCFLRTILHSFVA